MRPAPPVGGQTGTAAAGGGRRDRAPVKWRGRTVIRDARHLAAIILATVSVAEPISSCPSASEFECDREIRHVRNQCLGTPEASGRDC